MQVSHADDWQKAGLPSSVSCGSPLLRLSLLDRLPSNFALGDMALAIVSGTSEPAFDVVARGQQGSMGKNHCEAGYIALDPVIVAALRYLGRACHSAQRLTRLAYEPRNFAGR